MLELHSNVRFARQMKASGGSSTGGLSGASLVLLVTHNLVWWFFLVPFLTPMSYETGFTLYSAILFTRFLANSWINLRDLTWEEYYAYPLRIP